MEPRTELVCASAGLTLATTRLGTGGNQKLQEWSVLRALQAKAELYRDPAELKAEVDSWMSRFHSADEEEVAPDADGWIRVQETRKGKKRVTGGVDSWGVFASTMGQTKKRRKRSKSQCYDDFYAFQVKNKKVTSATDAAKV